MTKLIGLGIFMGLFICAVYDKIEDAPSKPDKSNCKTVRIDEKSLIKKGQALGVFNVNANASDTIIMIPLNASQNFRDSVLPIIERGDLKVVQTAVLQNVGAPKP